MSLLNGSEIRRKYRGLIGVQPKIPIRDTATLSLVYTPGVARPCLEINEHSLRSFDYTMRGNTVGIVTDGSSVYGLGNVVVVVVVVGTWHAPASVAPPVSEIVYDPPTHAEYQRDLQDVAAMV